MILFEFSKPYTWYLLLNYIETSGGGTMMGVEVGFRAGQIQFKSNQIDGQIEGHQTNTVKVRMVKVRITRLSRSN